MFSIKKNQLSKTTRQVPMTTILNGIKSGTRQHEIEQLRTCTDPEQRKSIKQSLPLFFCCTFADPDAGSGAANVDTHSGVMIFDLDKLESGEADTLTETLRRSPVWPYVVFVFVSPNMGLKIGLRTSFTGTDNEWYRYCYKKLMQLLINHGMPDQNLDVSTCNLNRGTYLSHDPDAYVNADAKTMTIPQRWHAEYTEMQRPSMAHAASNAILKANSTYDAKHAENYVNQSFERITSTMGKGNRHNQVFQLAMTGFRAGYDVMQVAELLDRLKPLGHWTEGRSTMSKAQEVFAGWDGIVDQRFYKETSQQLHDRWMSIL